MKLIMLEKKILVYSHISNNVCSFIFSFLSLFPCNAFFNLDYNTTGSKFYQQCYKPYGLPLKFLNSNSVLYSLMTLYDIGDLEKENIKSYFIGTTNPIFMNYKKVEFDCIINIDENKIVFSKLLGNSILRLGKKEKDLMKLINKQYDLNSKENDINEEDMNFEEFKGSDDFIRNIFKKYITDFLADIALVKYLVLTEDSELNNKTNKDSISIHSSEKKIHDLKQVLSGYNYSFILQWITTSKNFRFWNYEHDSELWCLSEHLEKINDVSKFYENGDHYIGDMKFGVPDGNGTLNTIMDGMGYTYVGEFKRGKKNGRGNLSSKDNKYNYDGGWKDDKKYGIGTLFDNGDKYTGDFVDDKYNGNGTLCGKNGEIFECEFKNGKPHGLGRVTLVNGDVYIGNFEEGKICDQVSIKYKNGESYDGYYKDNKKWGYGCFNFKNGDTYVGDFENDLFNGEGILTKSNGEVQKGIFKDGVFEKKLDKLKREEEEEKRKEEEEKAKNKEKEENENNTESNKENKEKKDDAIIL